MQPLANPSCIASRKWLNVRSNKKGRCFRRATAQTSYFSVQKECYPKTRPTTPSSLQSDLLSTLTKYKRTIRIWMTISLPQEWCYDSYPLSFILEPDTHVGFSVEGTLIIRCPYSMMHSSFPTKTYWKLMLLQCNLIHVTKAYNLDNAHEATNATNQKMRMCISAPPRSEVRALSMRKSALMYIRPLSWRVARS